MQTQSLSIICHPKQNRMIEITNPEWIGDAELKYSETKEWGNIMIQSSGFLRYVIFEDII